MLYFIGFYLTFEQPSLCLNVFVCHIATVAWKLWLRLGYICKSGLGIDSNGPDQ